MLLNNNNIGIGVGGSNDRGIIYTFFFCYPQCKRQTFNVVEFFFALLRFYTHPERQICYFKILHDNTIWKSIYRFEHWKKNIYNTTILSTQTKKNHSIDPICFQKKNDEKLFYLCFGISCGLNICRWAKPCGNWFLV